MGGIRGGWSGGGKNCENKREGEDTKRRKGGGFVCCVFEVLKAKRKEGKREMALYPRRKTYDCNAARIPRAYLYLLWGWRCLSVSCSVSSAFSYHYLVLGVWVDEGFLPLFVGVVLYGSVVLDT